MIVKSPYGDAEFPDDTPPAVIRRVMAEHAARQVIGSEQPAWAKRLAQIGSEVDQGVGQAFLDPAEGMAQILGNLPGVGKILRGLPGMDWLGKGLDAMRQRVAVSPVASAARVAGSFANPVYWAGPGAATRLGRLAESAIRGAASAAVQPQEGDFSWSGKAGQAAAGAGLGSVVSGLGESVGRPLAKETQDILDKGIRLTPGAMSENLQGAERSLARAPIFGRVVEHGRDISLDDITKALNGANSKLTFVATPQFSIDMRNLLSRVGNQITTPSDQAEFGSILTKQILPAIKPRMSGDDFAKLVTTVNRWGARMRLAAARDPSLYNKQTMATGFHQLGELIQNYAQGPAEAKATREAARAAYRRYMQSIMPPGRRSLTTGPTERARVAGVAPTAAELALGYLGYNTAGLPGIAAAATPLAVYTGPGLSALSRIARSALRQRMGPVTRTIAGPVGAVAGEEAGQ